MKKIKLLIILFSLILICSSCGAGQMEKDVKEFLQCRARIISFKNSEIYNDEFVHKLLIKFEMIQINKEKKCELTKKGRDNYLNIELCSGKNGIIYADFELIDVEKVEIGKSNGVKIYALNVKTKTKVRTWMKEAYPKADLNIQALYKNVIESDGKTDVLQVRYPFQR